MRNLKKSLSLVLAIALLVSSVFVGGLTASAALDLYSTTNTYDDPEGYGLVAGTYDKQPVIFSGKSITTNEDGSTTTNYEDYYYFGAYGATVAQDPFNTEDDLTVYFDRAKNQTNAWPAYTRIYKGGTAKYDAFKAKANTTYEITLNYYSASTPAGQVNLQVRQHTGTRYINVTHNASKVLVPDLVEITGATEGWQKVTARFTTGDTAQYLFLMLSSPTGDSVYNNVQVYVDNVQLSECTSMTVYNFDGKNDKNVPVSENTTIAQLEMPTRDGYILTGVYADAELTTKLNASSKALDYLDTGVYYGWAKLNPGEYYAGFENYKAEANVKSFDSATTAIVSGNTFAGGYNIKVNAAANALNAFELRDKTAFETKADTKYVISFQYKASAAAKLYAGTAIASNVPGTATAIKGAELAAAEDWTSASIEVTLDKGNKEGYVPALMVQSAEDATVEFDHIYMTFPVEETQNIENKFVTSTDWYPVLRDPDEILPEEVPLDIWDGNTEVPADSNSDGVYEIDTPEKLAYIIKNGGTIYKTETTTDPETGDEVETQVAVVTNGSYILTKDIYLNDISKYDWLSDAKASGLKAWYHTDGVKCGFNGTIDGNFHTVYGLYSKYEWSCWQSNDGGRGFIPQVNAGQTATIKNLTIDYAHFDGETNAGAIVGNNHAGNVVIDSCTIGANVFITGYKPAAAVGGGYDNSKFTVTNTASYAKVEIEYLADGQNLNNACYGLVSTYFTGKSKVEFCFNANGPITSVKDGDVTVKNCFETEAGGYASAGATLLTKEQMQGKKVLTTKGTMPLLNVNGNYWTATESYPVLTASLGLEVVVLDIWDGTRVAPTTTDDAGTYLISKPEELAYVIYNGGAAGATYKLTNNIFLNNIDFIDWETGKAVAGYNPNSWYSNRAFQGTLDGDGYSVYGLYFNDNSTREEMTSASGTIRYNYVGLIPGTGNGTSVSLLKIGVDYMYINYYAAASPFIGKVGNNGTKPTIVVDQCYSGENVYVTAGMAACVVGADISASHKYTNIASNAHVYSSTVSFNPDQAVFLGNAWGPTWNGHYNCYNSVGAIVNRNYASRDTTHNMRYCNYTVGYIWAESAERDWHGYRLTVDQMKGPDALTNMPKLNLDWATQTATTMFTATDSFPVPTVMVGKMYVKPVVEETPEEDVVVEEIIDVTIPETYNVWDGTSVAPTVGTGTEEDPFHITNGSELYYVIKNQGKMTVKEIQVTTQTVQATDDEGNLLYEDDGVTPVYVTEEVQEEVDVVKTECYFVLDNDIYLNDLSKINWFTGSIADGYKVNKWITGGSAVFNGHIDGNGYGVYGVYAHDGKTNYSSTPTYTSGLIPRTAANGNVSVKNLTVDYFFSRYDSISGPIIGCVHSADATIENCVVGQNVYADSSYVGNLVGYAYGSGITLTIKDCYSWSKGNANSGHKAFVGYTHWTYVPTIKLINCYNAYGKMITENRTPFTATNCYEGVDGGLNAGVTTITDPANMKGEAALENTMAGIKRFYKSVKASFAVVNANNFVYLPAGTTFDEDFAPEFFDNRMAPLTTDDVMFTNRMVRGAYVRFTKEVDVTKINVPVSTAHRVAFGTAQELLASGYYDLETQVVSDNLDGQPENAVNYIFITDPHFDTQGDVGPLSPQHSAKQFALAIKMANEMDEIDFVALGGDLTNGGYGTNEAWATALEGYLAEINNCTKPVFVLVGNHDDNAYGTVNDSMTLEQFNAKVTSNDRWQAAIMDKFTNRTLSDGTVIKVVQDNDPYMSEKVNSKYFYYDLEAKNTRVICLNASDYEYAYDENGNFTLISNGSTSKNVRSNTYNGYNFWGYSKYQMEWLAEDALGTLPEDYNVIVLSHMAITADSDGQTYVNGTVLRDIMAAYQNKTAYTHTNYGISADFSEDKGRIMAYQHGHEHIVYDKYNADCDVWQFSSANPNPHGSLTTVMNENVSATDIMSVTEGYVYKQALGKGDTAMYINNFPTYEGDVTLDTTVDICDLVKLDNLEIAQLPTATAANITLEKLRKMLIGA